MIKLYLSDIIIGVDNVNSNLSLENIACEFEILSNKIKQLKKIHKLLVSEVYILKDHKICGYVLKDIVLKIKDKDNKSYMLSILTKQQYIKSQQSSIITFDNITYKSIVVNECYINKGIYISLWLNNQYKNRLPFNESYVTVMHQINDDYINKMILLDDSFYISRIYLDMLNSGYKLLFHTHAYNILCDNYYLSSYVAIENKIKYILDSNIFEHYDEINVKYESNGIGVIKENNPMIRIYFMRDDKYISFLEITNDHGKKNINNKLKSAKKKFEEKNNLKDLFDIKDDRYSRK